MDEHILVALIWFPAHCTNVLNIQKDPTERSCRDAWTITRLLMICPLLDLISLLNRSKFYLLSSSFLFLGERITNRIFSTNQSINQICSRISTRTAAIIDDCSGGCCACESRAVSPWPHSSIFHRHSRSGLLSKKKKGRSGDFMQRLYIWWPTEPIRCAVPKQGGGGAWICLEM